MSNLRAVIISALLSGVLVWVGHAALSSAPSVESAQHVPKPVHAEDPATQRAAGRLDGEDLFQAYVAWVAAAHVHAALHGEDAQLPSQF